MTCTSLASPIVSPMVKITNTFHNSVHIRRVYRFRVLISAFIGAFRRYVFKYNLSALRCRRLFFFFARHLINIFTRVPIRALPSANINRIGGKQKTLCTCGFWLFRRNAKKTRRQSVIKMKQYKVEVFKLQ